MVEAPNISESFKLYISDYIVMKNQSPKTEEAYRGALKLLIKKFGDIPIGDITFENIRDWRNWLLTWQKPDTARNNIVCIRMVLRFIKRRGYDVLNYEDIPVAKREKRVITYLTEQEMAEFITEVGRHVRGYSEVNRKRNVAIVTLLYATGLRVSELCTLDVNSFRDRSFVICGKSKDIRPGFINEAAEIAINDYLSYRTDSCKALFISPQTGNRIRTNTVREIFKNVCERSTFEGIHPHTIRHSYGTKLLAHKVDLRYIADLMGHQDLNTTRMYTHYSNPVLKDIYDNAHG